MLLFSENDFRWLDCPANLTAYNGCNYTVYAEFEIDNNSNTSCLDEVYRFTIHINADETYKDDKINRESVNGSLRLCIISLTFFVEEYYHDVEFSVFSKNHPEFISTVCEDLLDVYGKG